MKAHQVWQFVLSNSGHPCKFRTSRQIQETVTNNSCKLHNLQVIMQGAGIMGYKKNKNLESPLV
jgi:hypothetical protein